MSKGTLTITFEDTETDSEVMIVTSLMSAREAAMARETWLERFKALHMSAPAFDFSGFDAEGIWDDG